LPGGLTSFSALGSGKRSVSRCELAFSKLTSACRTQDWAEIAIESAEKRRGVCSVDPLPSPSRRYSAPVPTDVPPVAPAPEPSPQAPVIPLSATDVAARRWDDAKLRSLPKFANYTPGTPSQVMI
jgi:hypothetical protein